MFQLGYKTREIAFTIIAPNSTVLYNRYWRSSFGSSTVLFGFCPFGECPVADGVNYYLTMVDTYGDGWNGNVLAFKQNVIVANTFSFTAGDLMRLIYTSSPFVQSF